MRFFQKEWHFAWNDFSEESYARNLMAVHEQSAAFSAYWQHLEEIRPRISSSLYQVLRHADKALLPYSRLIEFRITDYPLGSAHTTQGRKRRPNPTAILLLHTEDDKRQYRFIFRKIGKLTIDFPSVEPMGSYPFDETGVSPNMVFDPHHSFGSVYWCELSAVDASTFSFDLLLSTGAIHSIQCDKISFSSRKLGRVTP